MSFLSAKVLVTFVQWTCHFHCQWTFMLGYFNRIVIYHTGFYLGRPGEDCSVVCNRTGYFCNPSLKTDGTTKEFLKKNASCSDTSMAKYSRQYHPSYSSGKCEGYQDIPKSINCSAKPSDSHAQRLCDCISPGNFTSFPALSSKHSSWYIFAADIVAGRNNVFVYSLLLINSCSS